MLSTEYDAVQIAKSPGIHIETTSYTTDNPDAPPIDVPTIFYSNGYQAALVDSFTYLTSMARALGMMLKGPSLRPEEINSLKNQIFALTRASTVLRYWVKDNKKK